jgi:hypothetical protein
VTGAVIKEVGLVVSERVDVLLVVRLGMAWVVMFC